MTTKFFRGFRESVGAEFAPSRYRMWLQGFVGGVIGAVAASFVSILLFVLAAAPLLQDPAIQSAKLLAVFDSLEPLPLARTNPAVYLAGFALIGGVHGLVFAGIVRGLPRPRMKRGLAFGLLLWAVQTIFFEYFTAFNLLGEPLPLVALELVLWLPVLITEGIIISVVFGTAGSLHLGEAQVGGSIPPAALR